MRGGWEERKRTKQNLLLTLHILTYWIPHAHTRPHTCMHTHAVIILPQTQTDRQGCIPPGFLLLLSSPSHWMIYTCDHRVGARKKDPVNVCQVDVLLWLKGHAQVPSRINSLNHWNGLTHTHAHAYKTTYTYIPMHTCNSTYTCTGLQRCTQVYIHEIHKLLYKACRPGCFSFTISTQGFRPHFSYSIFK